MVSDLGANDDFEMALFLPIVASDFMGGRRYPQVGSAATTRRVEELAYLAPDSTIVEHLLSQKNTRMSRSVRKAVLRPNKNVNENQVDKMPKIQDLQV